MTELLRTSGPLMVRELESGGYEVMEDWWAWWSELPMWEARLNDGTGAIAARKAHLHKGFRFDGGSGPARDAGGMQGYGVHDLVYRLMRQGKLFPVKRWRAVADLFMYKLHRAAGMSWIRAQWLYRGVRLFAAGHAKQQPIDKESVVKEAV